MIVSMLHGNEALLMLCLYAVLAVDSIINSMSQIYFILYFSMLEGIKMLPFLCTQ